MESMILQSDLVEQKVDIEMRFLLTIVVVVVAAVVVLLIFVCFFLYLF